MQSLAHASALIARNALLETRQKIEFDEGGRGHRVEEDSLAVRTDSSVCTLA